VNKRPAVGVRAANAAPAPPASPEAGRARRLSVKSQRVLEQLGVAAALEHGATLALAGSTYQLLKDPQTFIRLAFSHDEEGRLCVGYARGSGDEWYAVEAEPYSRRALGYYQRRLKRLGEVVESERARR